MKINSQEYPITGYAESKEFGELPIVDIPMMSDYKWQLKCLKDRMKNPALYRDVLGENVEQVVVRIKRWLLENGATEEELKEAVA